MIKPLTNQCLVAIFPPDDTSHGGVYIPETSRHGPKDEKKPPVKGIVTAIGPWRKTKTGLSILPEVKLGDIVVCSAYAGVKMNRDIGERFVMVKTQDILAVLTPA